MRNNIIIVLDLETGSNRVSDCEITQVAALAVDPVTLNPIAGGEFESMMRPLEPEKLQEDALLITRKTREELAEAPHPERVWAAFEAWCKQWRLGGNAGRTSLPIAAGHNIINFDLPIINRYCQKYGPTRTEGNGEVSQALFSSLYYRDTIQLLDYWTESLAEPAKLSLDFLRKYFAMPKASLENAHDALQDVRDTAAILKKLMELSRRHARRIVFKDCFDEAKAAAEAARRNERTNSKSPKGSRGVG